MGKVIMLSLVENEVLNVKSGIRFTLEVGFSLGELAQVCKPKFNFFRHSLMLRQLQKKELISSKTRKATHQKPKIVLVSGKWHYFNYGST